MISPVLMVGIGAVAIAIGFGVARRARDAEWRTDPWDVAGALLKILGAFTVLAGLALCIPPPRNLMADPTVATHTLSPQDRGYSPSSGRPTAAISLGRGRRGLQDSPKP
jgi:hypothetical protein